MPDIYVMLVKLGMVLGFQNIHDEYVENLHSSFFSYEMIARKSRLSTTQYVRISKLIVPISAYNEMVKNANYSLQKAFEQVNSEKKERERVAYDGKYLLNFPCPQVT